jgi:hypothetical protein
MGRDVGFWREKKGIERGQGEALRSLENRSGDKKEMENKQRKR